MARQTRAQRRARRQQQAEEQAGVAQRPRARQQVPAVEPVAVQPAGREKERGGIRRFLGESWGELQKVEWPTQNHVIQGTVVVLIACIIVGTYLWLNDQLWQYLVKHVVLR